MCLRRYGLAIAIAIANAIPKHGRQQSAFSEPTLSISNDSALVVSDNCLPCYRIVLAKIPEMPKILPFLGWWQKMP